MISTLECLDCVRCSVIPFYTYIYTYQGGFAYPEASRVRYMCSWSIVAMLNGDRSADFCSKQHCGLLFLTASLRVQSTVLSLSFSTIKRWALSAIFAYSLR
jgi:hypothetical protein